MRQLIVEQWRLTDRALVAAYRERHGEAAVREDGYDELQVISRFGVVHFPRQVCYNADSRSAPLVCAPLWAIAI
jgi:hypothetical protein